jgi:hypothetical protein
VEVEIACDRVGRKDRAGRKFEGVDRRERKRERDGRTDQYARLLTKDSKRVDKEGDDVTARVEGMGSYGCR